MSAPLVSLLIILFAPLPLGFFHILISGFLFCDLFKHENLKKKKKNLSLLFCTGCVCTVSARTQAEILCSFIFAGSLSPRMFSQ